MKVFRSIFVLFTITMFAACDASTGAPFTPSPDDHTIQPDAAGEDAAQPDTYTSPPKCDDPAQIYSPQLSRCAFPPEIDITGGVWECVTTCLNEPEYNPDGRYEHHTFTFTVDGAYMVAIWDDGDREKFEGTFEKKHFIISRTNIAGSIRTYESTSITNTIITGTGAIKPNLTEPVPDEPLELRCQR